MKDTTKPITRARIDYDKKKDWIFVLTRFQGYPLDGICNVRKDNDYSWQKTPHRCFYTGSPSDIQSEPIYDCTELNAWEVFYWKIKKFLSNQFFSS